ncbi:MAG: C-GCAxxG-C-C family protein [Eubacteriales bacterium]|nr:C-GCAxxG-C-C family protein [Eubacteriales bacterium]
MSELREPIDGEAKAAKARDLFLEGYNCAQAVFAAFAEEMGLSQEQALRIASGMGGGMGGLRFTCGTVSAMFMVLGALQGYDDPEDKVGKQQLYARVQGLHARFTDQYHTSNCRELLSAAGIAAKAEPEARTPEYYRVRPCARYVEASARLLSEEINAGL